MRNPAGHSSSGQCTTLRELLDEWWIDDPAGPPSDAERAAARAELRSELAEALVSELDLRYLEDGDQ